jgi:hypothetical protein
MKDIAGPSLGNRSGARTRRSGPARLRDTGAARRRAVAATGGERRASARAALSARAPARRRTRQLCSSSSPVSTSTGSLHRRGRRAAVVRDRAGQGCVGQWRVIAALHSLGATAMAATWYRGSSSAVTSSPSQAFRVMACCRGERAGGRQPSARTGPTSRGGLPLAGRRSFAVAQPRLSRILRQIPDVARCLAALLKRRGGGLDRRVANLRASWLLQKLSTLD